MTPSANFKGLFRDESWERFGKKFTAQKSGGGCGGFVLVKLNMSLNMRAEIVCPKCKHKHIRHIIDGEVRESGRF